MLCSCSCLHVAPLAPGTSELSGSPYALLGVLRITSPSLPSQVALDSVMKGRTTVIVAHRLSTIRGADKIAVMRKGEVIEEGTHTMLSLRGGAYASLIRAQHGSVIGSVLGSVMSGSSAAADVKALAWAEEQEELAAKEEAAKAALAASESEVVADGGSAEAEAAGKGGPKARGAALGGCEGELRCSSKAGSGSTSGQHSKHELSHMRSGHEVSPITSVFAGQEAQGS